VSDGLLSSTLGYSVTTSTNGYRRRHLSGPSSQDWDRGVACTVRHEGHPPAALQTNVGVRAGVVRPQPWAATNSYETAYAGRYFGPDFRLVIG